MIARNTKQPVILMLTNEHVARLIAKMQSENLDPFKPEVMDQYITYKLGIGNEFPHP